MPAPMIATLLFVLMRDILSYPDLCQASTS